ncbi:MAG: aminotransferase class V-fold PLP-dependent enzyme [Steroidobacteraceae bacterium]|nr:aminotransferase class V-fold PLP-dependent enzyme [Steroidobacteraceae bacterium]
MTAPLYLDYAATTPLHPQVARAMSEVLSHAAEYGNAASITHVFGRRAAARVEAARAQVAALVGAQPEEIVFTSGATESNNLALLGVARANAPCGRHIITSRIEHKAVLDPCKQLEREGFTVTYLTPGADGRVSPDSVRAAFRPDTTLVSIMHVNNETGVVQDIRAIGELCREREIVFHTDAAQSAGKLPIQVETLPVDLLSFTAHKIYGPQGIGALYVRSGVRPRVWPVSFGGGQERGLRPGTLPLHQIVGFGVACELAAQALDAGTTRLRVLQDRLWAALRRLDGVHLNGEGAPRVPGILNVSFEGVEGESLVTALTSLALTTGSACNSASGEPSYVLRALGRNTQLAQSSLRISLGRGTSEADVDAAAHAICEQVARLRAVSPANTSSPGTSTHLPATATPAIATTHAQLSAAPAEETASEGGAGSSGEAGAGPELDPLSPLARKYFTALPGAGVLSESQVPAGTRILRGEAGRAADGTWVRFHLAVCDTVVKAALFQAYGCPHTLAVASWLTTQLPGRPRLDAVPGTPAAWLELMQAPVEKLGRLLVVEDALRATLQQWNEAH